jgi:hypothetical protein
MYFPLSHAIISANKIRGFKSKTNVVQSVVEQCIKEAGKKASKDAADNLKAFMRTPRKDQRVMLSNLRNDQVKFTNNNTTLRINKTYFKHLVQKHMNKQRFAN